MVSMSTLGNQTTALLDPSWHEVASRIADELRHDPRQDRMAKVSSLLHTFRSQGSHCDIPEMVSALAARGIMVRAGESEISRRDVLDLYLSDAEAAPQAGAAAPGIRLSRWRTGQVGVPEPFDGIDKPDMATDEMYWFDVDPRGTDPSPEVVREVTDQLQPWCPGLNKMIVRDLLTPDIEPKSETYGSERTGVRTISVPALVAREIPDDDDDFDGLDEQLVIQIVELVVGPGWMVTCWHRSRTLVGGGVAHEGPPLVREPFLSHVGHRWMHDPTDLADTTEAKEVADLAIYLARSLVATFGASLRMLQRWVSSWEVGFYTTLGDKDAVRSPGGAAERKSLKAAAAEISNYLAIVGEFSRCVNAFRLAGDEMPNETWFADPERGTKAAAPSEAVNAQSKALESSVEAAADKLSQLYDEIRADMDLLMIQSQASQQESSERLQGYLGKVTGLILVPTFVAGLFGANTALPGQGSWGGFELMVVLMVVSAAASYWFIRRLIT